MFKHHSKLMAGAVLASAFLAGCGSSSGDGDGGNQASTGPGTSPPAPPVQQTITAVADYVRNLFASTGDKTEPVDINGLTLATDDRSEPAAVD